MHIEDSAARCKSLLNAIRCISHMSWATEGSLIEPVHCISGIQNGLWMHGVLFSQKVVLEKGALSRRGIPH